MKFKLSSVASHLFLHGILLLLIGGIWGGISSGLKHGKMTKSVTWNQDLKELRGACAGIQIKIAGLYAEKSAWEIQRMITDIPNPYDQVRYWETCQARADEIAEKISLEKVRLEEYRKKHNKVLETALSRDVWVTQSKEIFAEAFEVSAL